jgi:hypothetical protein
MYRLHGLVRAPRGVYPEHRRIIRRAVRELVVGRILLVTAVRLKVEEDQLVGIFGEIGVLVDGLKYA